MKITHPFKSNRERKTDKLLNSFFTYCLLKYGKINKKVSSKHTQLGFLISSLNHPTRFYKDYSLNSNQTVSLNNIALFELITMDNLDSLINGLFKIKKYFSSSDEYALYDTLMGFKNSILNNSLGNILYNIGSISFPEDHKLHRYIQSINIHISSLTSTLLSLRLTINLSEIFQQEEIDTILNNHPNRKKRLYFRKDKCIFNYKYWSIATTSPDSYKKEQIEDVLTEIKFRILSEFNKYIPLYFYNYKTLCPSIESYSGKNLTNSSSNNIDEYLSYLGMNRFPSLFNSFFKSGEYEYRIYNNVFDICDNSIKILINNLNKTLITNFIYELNNYYSNILYINGLIKMFNNDISKLKIDLSNLLYNSKTTYKNSLKIRRSLETMYINISIIKNEISPNTLDSDINYIYDLIEIKPNDINTDSLQYLKNITISNLNIIEKKFESYKQLIDTSINLLTLSSNKKLNNISLFLSIFTVLLTIITLIFTFLQFLNTDITTLLINFKSLLYYFKII